jgi:Flp pilus assembly protein CpaB
MSYRTRNITIASGLAALAIVFMIVYTSNDSSGTSEVAKGLVGVFFAARDIPQGTPGSTLQADGLVKKRVPADTVIRGAISKRQSISGTVATQNILEGQQISTRGFGPIAASGVLARISGSQRAVQLAGDKNQVLDGTLKPGDHVDVFATWAVPESCTTCHYTGVIVRNALVLATADQLGAGNDAETPVQLRLSGSEAERVLWVTKYGDWSLVLRPVVKPKNAKGVVTSKTILRSSENGASSR